MTRWALVLLMMTLTTMPAAAQAGQERDTAATASASMPTPSEPGQAPRASSGLLFGEDLEGHLAVFDERHRLVIELDKTAGQPVRVGIEPGVYEVRLQTSGEPVWADVQVERSSFTAVNRARFAAPSPAARPSPSERPASRTDGDRGPLSIERHRPVDRSHRIELRFAMYRNPSATFVEDGHHVSWGSGDVGGGFEYLHYVSPDLAVGFAIDGQTRGEGSGDWWDDDWDNGASTVAMPIVVRWNFLRRTTEWRGIDPYVTGGVGPVFRADWSSTGTRHHSTSASVSTTIGARVGAGFDVRLGSVWTLGLMGAWRWSDRPSGVTGYGKHDQGGEVAFTMGWMFGRRR